MAHQAAGIVARDLGNAQEGVRELRIALRLARQTGSITRETDVLATLGAALVHAGHTADGFAAFDQAVQQSSGVLAGRVLHRRAMALWALGRHAAALDDLRHAIGILRRADDRIYTARALTARGLVYTDLGSPGRADADFVAAERLFAETGQDLESIYVVHNRAMTAFVAGDLLAALSCLDEAARGYRLLNAPNPSLSIDRCTVLLAAGLAADALAEADAAVRDIEQSHGRPTWKAVLLLTAARCALAANQPQAAQDWAQAACRLFRSQQSAWWQAHAAGVLAQAKYATGLASAKLLRESDRAAFSLEMVGSSDVARAHLLAGRVALKLGRPGDAGRHFTKAAQSRHRGPAWSRACGWLSEALRAEIDGDLRRMFSACRQGLEVLDEHQFTLGASELRAQATAHGSELAALAQRHASQTHRPRLLLAWSERWRATALAVPAVRPVANAELGAGLAALRAAAKRVETARQAASTASVQREQRRLEREQRQLERVVRACALRTQGLTHQGPGAVRIPELLDELGPARLVEIVDVDGILHVLVCGTGRVRQFTAGRVADASHAADFACFALRRLARSRPGDEVDSALAILKAVGPKLQDTLLGPACRYLGDGPVIIVPPGKLHAIPWALIPELHDRVISVTPSASAWLRVRATPPPARHHVTLARGPGLLTNGAEIPPVTQLYDDVTVLTDGAATAEKVLYALDGAWLAHIAAHGIFRADSPLFSSLRMADGPLTAYDFEQLHRAPYRLVLSSCESGALAPAGADELLGLVSSLLPLGTAGVVAAIAPLNDHAVVPVMLDLHRNLRAGHTLAESVHAVRCGSSGDPIHTATALSLVALGAA
ncbi:MAG TPA: CHAT domain-containing tetratricopeptide repeat protein [Streptosporangiaceae bacterium]|nr:CHAT domain-containing tetratricopeptide repeat protein [Streptosporangiaceae bacterium]